MTDPEITLFHGTSLEAAELILSAGFQKGCFANDLEAAREWSDDSTQTTIVAASFSANEIEALFTKGAKAFKYGPCTQFRLRSGMIVPRAKLRLMTQEGLQNHPDWVST